MIIRISKQKGDSYLYLTLEWCDQTCIDPQNWLE